jgi:hypothetical protein
MQKKPHRRFNEKRGNADKRKGSVWNGISLSPFRLHIFTQRKARKQSIPVINSNHNKPKHSFFPSLSPCKKNTEFIQKFIKEVPFGSFRLFQALETVRPERLFCRIPALLAVGVLLSSTSVQADSSLYRMQEKKEFLTQMRQELKEAYQKQELERKKHTARVQRVLERSKTAVLPSVGSGSSASAERARMASKKAEKVARSRSWRRFWISLASFIGLAAWAFMVHRRLESNVSQK